MPELVNFFPLSVYVQKMGIAENERERYAKIIEKDAATSEVLKKSQNSTWTGDVNGHGFLHKRKEFKKLFTAVTENIREYAAELGANADILDFYFTRSWGTVQNRKERVAFHSHMQSHISAVYYPRVPKDSGMLIFDVNPNPNEFIPGLIREEHVKRNVLRPSPLLAQNMNIGVETDMLVLFPSKINHATQANETGQTRISIACDIVCMIKDPQGHEFFLPPPHKWRKFS